MLNRCDAKLFPGKTYCLYYNAVKLDVTGDKRFSNKE